MVGAIAALGAPVADRAPSIGRLIVDGDISPVATVTVLTFAALYLAGRRRVSTWPASRTAAFVSGMAVLLVALDSGLGVYDEHFLALHMTQHVLLGMVVPALLTIGEPLTLAVQASRRRGQRRLVAILRSRAIGAITHPLLGWMLFSGSMVAVYFTPLYDISLRHPVVHVGLHAHFLFSGLLFYRPVLGIDSNSPRLPFGARLLYVFLVTPVHAFIGLGLLSGTSPLFQGHSLSDQHAGAAVFWGASELVTLATLIVVAVQWMAYDEREAARTDRRLDGQRPAPTTSQTRRGPGD